MSFSARVGINFHESMSGTIVAGVTDPDKAAVQAAGRPRNFSFRLLVDIPRLQAFLAAPTHVADVVRGSVTWEGVCRPETPIMSGGTITMYKHVTPDGKRKAFDFVFGFRGDDGAWYTFIGEKRLLDDGDFDVLQDLSRIYARIQKAGVTVAAGVTTLHIDELVDQLLSMRVSEAQNVGEDLSARLAFFTFMNNELKQVYPELPLFFYHDDRRYLTPSEWRALALISRAMLPFPLPANGPTIDDTVLNVQNFIRNATPEALHEVRSQLRLLGTFAPIFDGHVNQVRLWLEQNIPTMSHDQLDLIDRLKLVAVVPYYAHPKADAVVGYSRPVFKKTLQTRLPIATTPPNDDYDLVIVGAGVAGALLAHRAAVEKNQKVLVLEAGPYQPEWEISSDEVPMTARLYKDSALQLTEEGLTILQGSCVGGGGVVNNAICFQLPEAQYQRWATAGFPVKESDLRKAYKTVAGELGIQPVSKLAGPLNPAKRFLGKLGPIQVPAVDKPPPLGVSECLVNITKDCEGTGLCNTGCGNERKRNSFQVYLKQALASGRCTLVANARVVDVTLSGNAAPFTVSGMKVRVDGQDVVVKGKQYVIAAGAIASSVLLLASEVRKKLPALPIGKRFTANVGSPSYVVATEVLHPTPSLQISHAYLPHNGEGFVVESWFAPPGAVGLTMPGYLDVHAKRLKRYSKSLVIASLVGVSPNGTVAINGQGRAVIRLPVVGDDLKRVVAGPATIARAVLASGDTKLDHVVLGTRFGHEVRTPADVVAFENSVTSARQLRLGTGHPQGGNAMSSDAAISVVDEGFRVRGVKNLRVCDSSVFPDVAGVNPQWTVMALAEVCSQGL